LHRFISKCGRCHSVIALGTSGTLAIAEVIAVGKPDWQPKQRMTGASWNSHRSCFKKTIANFLSVISVFAAHRRTKMLDFVDFKLQREATESYFAGKLSDDVMVL
jgi:hypothetical protein